MKKLRNWATNGTRYMYDVNAVEAYEAGARDMRKRIYDLIKETESTNSENLKQDPRLAAYLMLELADRVYNLGEDNEV